MAVDTLILLNGSTGQLVIPDLGIELPAGDDLDLLQSSEDEQLLESTDLSTAMGVTGVTVKLNGGSAMTYQNVIDYLQKISFYFNLDYAYISGKDSATDITGAELERLTDGSDVSSSPQLHNHDTRYYTQTQLSTSGQSTVNWGNISGAPSFGSLHWKDPADRTNAGYGSGTMLPLTGNAIDDARIVTDDGDGKAAQYVCVAISGAWNVQWIKIADVDWGNASSIGVTPNGNLGSSNVQAALYELQDDIDGLSLDEAYNRGSLITVDNTNVNWKLTSAKVFEVTDSGGSNVIFSVTGGTTGGSFYFNGTVASTIGTTAANLTISTTTSGTLNISSSGTLNLKDQYLTSGIPLSESGVTGLDAYFSTHATSIIGAINYLAENVAGGMTIVDGQLYIYDSTRSKHLSAANIEYVFADLSTKGTYLAIGNAQATTIGYKLPTKATIIGITAIADTAADGQQIEIRKNSSATPVATFTFTSQAYSSWTTDVDLLAGDILQAFSTWSSGSPIKNVVVSVYVRWRTP